MEREMSQFMNDKLNRKGGKKYAIENTFKS